MNSIKVKYKIDTIFINSVKSKTSESHILLVDLAAKINLKKSDKFVASSNVSMYYTWKI